MTDFTLRPLTVPERKYTYAQSSQLQGQTGNIGYLRGDFGSSGDQFYTTWFDTRPQWKSDEFKRDLDDVINALRSEKYGLLKNRVAMRSFGRANKDSEIQNSYATVFGFRADTEKYAFLLRCIPVRGDYNFYCFCYVKEWLDKHIEEANRDIRFIDSHYKELFRIPDGERIIVTDRDDLTPFDVNRPDIPREIFEQVEIELKYEGYIVRQTAQINEMRRLEVKAIPPETDYNKIDGLRLEAREKLSKIRPMNVGQASRISGVSPADISVLLIYLAKEGK